MKWDVIAHLCVEKRSRFDFILNQAFRKDEGSFYRYDLFYRNKDIDFTGLRLTLDNDDYDFFSEIFEQPFLKLYNHFHLERELPVLLLGRKDEFTWQTIYQRQMLWHEIQNWTHFRNPVFMQSEDDYLRIGYFMLHMYQLWKEGREKLGWVSLVVNRGLTTELRLVKSSLTPEAY